MSNPFCNDATCSSQEGDERTNLIINYLPQNVTEEELHRMFVVVGPIKSCRIVKDLKTGYSYGYGFVDFVNPADAVKAVSSFNSIQVQHKRIKVSYARPSGNYIKDTNLYIQNIPRSLLIENLEELFSPFGTIVQKSLLKDKITGYSRGVGFIRYDKKLEAEAAINAMNGKILEGGSQPLIVRLAEEHGKNKGSYYLGLQAGFNDINNRGRGLPRSMAPPATLFGIGRGSYNHSIGKMPFNRPNKRFNPMGPCGPYGGGGAEFHNQYSSF